MHKICPFHGLTLPFIFSGTAVVGGRSTTFHPNHERNASSLVPTPLACTGTKGNLYEVVGTARHSETLEPMTVYRALYGEHGFVGAPSRHVCRAGHHRRVLRPALRKVRRCHPLPAHPPFDLLYFY